VDHGLNVSDAAAALFTSQPGVSKQVRQLEDELGVRVFVRIGKRIASVTPAGESVMNLDSPRADQQRLFGRLRLPSGHAATAVVLATVSATVAPVAMHPGTSGQ